MEELITPRQAHIAQLTKSKDSLLLLLFSHRSGSDPFVWDVCAQFGLTLCPHRMRVSNVFLLLWQSVLALGCMSSESIQESARTYGWQADEVEFNPQRYHEVQLTEKTMVYTHMRDEQVVADMRAYLAPLMVKRGLPGIATEARLYNATLCVYPTEMVLFCDEFTISHIPHVDREDEIEGADSGTE